MIEEFEPIICILMKDGPFSLDAFFAGSSHTDLACFVGTTGKAWKDLFSTPVDTPRGQNPLAQTVQKKPFDAGQSVLKSTENGGSRMRRLLMVSDWDRME